MVKKSKKLLSVLLSVLMAVSCFALPFSINAAGAVAYEDENSVTGYVTTDPIIYVHGTFNGTLHDISDVHQYDYMMNGSVIADGSYAGECKTKVTVSEKTISSVTAVGVDGANVYVENGLLKGDLGSAYSVDPSDNSKSVTLKFTFSDGTFEYHKLPVIANPVATHVAASTYNMYYQWINNSDKRRAVPIFVLANGSYGSLSGGSNSSTGGKVQANSSGNQNFALMYSPFSSTFDVWDSGNWVFAIDSMSQDGPSVPFNKVAGYFSSNSYNLNGSKSAVMTVNSPTAVYYLDRSSGNNYGVDHSANSDTYKLNIDTSSLYFSGSLYNSRWDIDSTGCGNSMSSAGDGNLTCGALTPNALDVRTETKGTTVLNGTISGTGEKDYSYEEHYQSDELSSQYITTKVITNIKVVITNKDADGERTVYNSCIGKKLKASDYTPDTWKTYQEALLNMEEWLNDNIDTSSGSALKTALDNAKNGLEKRATDLSAFNKVREIITSSTFDSSVYTTEAQQKINEVLSNMNACLDSNGNALISVSQNYINNLITEALTYITVKDKNDNPNTNLQNQKFTLTVNSTVDGVAATASKSYAFGKVANINDVFDLQGYLNDSHTVSCVVSTPNSTNAKDVVIDLTMFDKTFFMQQDITVTLDIKTKGEGVVIIQGYDGSVITSYTGTAVLSEDGKTLTVNGETVSPIESPTYTFTKWVKVSTADGTVVYKQVGSRISQANKITVVDGSISNTPESLNAGYTINYTGSDTFLAWVKIVSDVTVVDSYQATDLVRYTSTEGSVTYIAITEQNIDSSTLGPNNDIKLSDDIKQTIQHKAPATYSTGYVANDKFVISGEFTNTGIDTSKYTITSVGVVISKTNTEPTKGGSACAALEIKNYSSSGTFTASINSSVSTLYGRTYVAYTENVDGVGEVTRIAYGPVCTINK